MTDNPFSAPTTPAGEPKPRRTPIAAYSDKDLKKWEKQADNLFGWQIYLVILGLISFVFVVMTAQADPLLAVVNGLLGALYSTTALVSYKRLPLGRPIALAAFAVMVALGVLNLADGSTGGLVQILLGGAGFVHYWQAKAFFEPDLIPTRAQLKHETERREREANRTKNLS